MSCPFDIQVIGELKIGVDVFPDQLIDNCAIINAFDFNALKVELPAPFLYICNRSYPDLKPLTREQEIRKGLLVIRIDLEQNDIFRRMPAQNGASQQP